jgi:hypothetical protein
MLLFKQFFLTLIPRNLGRTLVEWIRESHSDTDGKTYLNVTEVM